MASNKEQNLLPGASAILEAGPGSIALFDRNSGRIVYGNRQFENVLGYGKDDIGPGGLGLDTLLPAEQRERFLLQLDFVTDNPSEYSKYSVYTLVSKSGAHTRYYVYGSPMREYDQLFHLLIIPDLSSWDFPFNSFDARNLFLKQLESDKHGSFEWLMESGRIFWTDGLYDIYEVERGTRIDREFIRSFTHPEDSKKVEVLLQRAMENSSGDIEMRIVTRGNNVKVLRILVSLIKDEKDQPAKLVGSVKDITSQRKIEQDLKRKVEELNKSNKELEEFAYVASHDLQEPLRKISTFSDRLSEKYGDILTGEGAMYLERMMASAENMRILINNLLEYSRVTRYNEPFSKVGLDFVVRQVKTALELVVEETGATIESDKLPEVEGSLTQLTQLFTNIIGNAIKFRKAGVPPVIRIGLSEVTAEDLSKFDLSPGKPYCKITIADNGIGFEEEYAEKIFQIFQRLHGKSEYPGSGIGLAICKRIVDNHGGVIYADSGPEGGACFSLILPVVN